MVLRQLAADDAPLMLEWMHDPDINCNFRFNAAEYTLEDVYSFIQKANEEFCEKTSFHFAITEDGGEYLGTISLKDINTTDRNAEYAICLRKCAWGSGIGQLATEEILRFGFEELKLHRIALNVLAENETAVRLYKKCGFIYEGEWKDCLYLRGSFHSWKWYRVLEEDWKRMKHDT